MKNQDITRRTFMRSLAGSAVLGAVSSASPAKSIDYDAKFGKDWDDAIEENNLREEVSRLMKKTNMTVRYDVQFTYKDIVGSNVSLANLKRIRDDLNLQPNIGGRGSIYFHSMVNHL